MHTMGDTSMSLGVILGLIGARLGWNEVDALVSLAIAMVIVWAAWTIVHDASLVLADAVARDPREIMTAVLATRGWRPPTGSEHGPRARICWSTSTSRSTLG